MRFVSLLLLVSSAVLAGASQQLSVRVDGEGYLRFVRDGRVVLARSARLTIRSGQIVQQDGYPLLPIVTAPDAASLSVDLDGTIKANGQKAGRLVLAIASNVTPLASSTDLMVASDRPRLVNPGEDSNAVLRTDSPPTLEPPSPPRGVSKRIEITVRELSTLGTDRVRLSDIAQIAGPTGDIERVKGVDLGYAPTLGARRRIDQGSIRLALKQAGFKPESLSLVTPKEVVVERRSQVIEASRFIEAAQERVKTTYGSGIETPTTSLPPMIAPDGKLELVVEQLRPNNGQISCTVAVVINGKRFNSRTVTFKSSSLNQALRIGAEVKVRVRSNGAVLVTTGTVTRWDALTRTAQVKTADGALLSGLLAPSGAIEVTL